MIKTRKLRVLQHGMDDGDFEAKPWRALAAAILRRAARDAQGQGIQASDFRGLGLEDGDQIVADAREFLADPVFRHLLAELGIEPGLIERLKEKI